MLARGRRTGQRDGRGAREETRAGMVDGSVTEGRRQHGRQPLRPGRWAGTAACKTGARLRFHTLLKITSEWVRKVNMKCRAVELPEDNVPGNPMASGR